MALQSMTALASITLQQASASVSFSGIPQNYRDLVLVFNGTTAIADGVGSRFNGDSGTNYSAARMFGNTASGALADIFTNFTRILQTAGDTNLSTFFISQIIDYSATNKHKTVLTRNGITSNNVSAITARWANTEAVTSIMVFSPGSSISAGSTIDLYGRIA